MSKEQLSEALTKMTDRANQFLTEAGLDKKFSVVAKPDDHSPVIEFHVTSHGRTSNSGFGMSAFLGDVGVQYGAFKTVYDPGDGSGQPPNEVVNLTEKPSLTPEPEIVAVIQALIAEELDHILWGEEICAREDAEGVNNDWH